MVQEATIYALASGVGPAGIAVVRVSGPRAAAAIEALTGVDKPAPRRLTLRVIRDGDGEVLDRAMVAWFPGPGSFSGEDVAEFHLHGGHAVVAGVLKRVGGLQDMRLAGPGEFTRRAFLNGKMDLTEAEGLADLVAARTGAQRRQAVAQMEGALGALYEGWRSELVRALGWIEVGLDFSDEEVPEDLEGRALEVLEGVREAIGVHLDDRRRGELLREGFRVAIVGPPNSGKSSLLNRLAGRDVAIVSTRAGTTRDVVEVQLDLGGFPVTLCDTAGLRETDEEVEAEGVRRALAEIERAGVVVAVGSPDTGAPVAPSGSETAILVWNKSDLGGPRGVKTGVAVSAMTGEGLDGLLDKLGDSVGALYGGWEAPAVSRARHREALEACRGALVRACSGASGELLAEDTRVAVDGLGRVLGRVDLDRVLDGVFAEFCIGK